METFPKNTTAHFITQLKDPISLYGEWEVAITEFHYPQTLYNVSEGGNQITVTLHGLKDVDAEGKKPILTIEIVHVKPGFYQGVGDFLSAVNAALAPLDIGEFSYNTSTKGSYLDLNEFGKVSRINLTFSPELAKQLGFEPDVDVSVTSVAKSVMNLNSGAPHQIFIYCDIIEPQIVGDTVAPLLRMVGSTQQTEQGFGDTNSRGFVTLHYVPVIKHEFNTIEIDLRSSMGLPIPFESGISAVILHFRPRIRHQVENI